jgi:hypothetical protein
MTRNEAITRTQKLDALHEAHVLAHDEFLEALHSGAPHSECERLHTASYAAFKAHDDLYFQMGTPEVAT